MSMSLKVTDEADDSITIESPEFSECAAVSLRVGGRSGVYFTADQADEVAAFLVRRAAEWRARNPEATR